MFSGVFAMDPMHGYPSGAPAGKPDSLSLKHTLHDAFGLLVFTTLPAAAFVLARRFRSTSRGWAIYSVATGVAMLTLFIWFGVAWESGSEVAGLLQRAAIITGWSWIAIMGLTADRLALESNSGAEPPS